MNSCTADLHDTGRIYRAFGLNIRSLLCLPGATVTDGESSVDVEVTEGRVPAQLKGSQTRRGCFQADEGRLLLFVDGVARYLVCDGRRVTFERESGASDEEVRAFLLTVVFSGVLYQRGDFMLRASVVVEGGEAVVFLGSSAAGESPISTGFDLCGYPVLTDELCVVRPCKDGRMALHPGFPCMKPWLDLMANDTLASNALCCIRDEVHKQPLPFDPEFTGPGLPLRKLYLLRYSSADEIMITPVSGPGAFAALQKLTYRFGMLKGLVDKPHHFQRVMEVARLVPMAIVARPAQPFLLSELVSRVEADLGVPGRSAISERHGRGAPFVTFSDIISETERAELQDYALKLKEADALQSNVAGENRFFQCIWNGSLVTPLISELATRIERRFGIEGTPVDPELGWVISVIYRGGYVQPHTDANHYLGKPLKHLRCNVVVSSPDDGGTPIIADEPVPLIERGGWGFFASEEMHSALAVKGTKPRIIYQFGYSVPKTWALPSLEARRP